MLSQPADNNQRKRSLLADGQDKLVIRGLIGLTCLSALPALRLLPASSVAALRETSVVFGVLFAGWFMQERIGNRRLSSAILVAIGRALVAVLR